MLSAFVLVALAQSHSIHAARASAPIVIDGKLDEADWARAETVIDFTQDQPDEGKPITQHTELKILYDEEALYFSFRCDDSGEVTANLTRRDGELVADVVWLDIDTRGDARSAFHFEVFASNTQRDAIRTGDGAYAYNWDGVWTSATQLDARGWTVEARLPLIELRYEPGQEAKFRAQAGRFIFRSNEHATWAFKPRKENGEMERYRPILGIDGLAAPRGITLRPFGVFAVRGNSSGVGALPSVGVDGRYGITSGLSFDATVLPDFGQVEADPALLNLSTFELFFPERRPFFLEGAELYSLFDAYGGGLDGQLFYSRRMGAAAPLSLPAGTSVVEQPSFTRIWSAAKLSGRVGDRVAIGLLDGLTAEEEGTLRQSDGSLAKVKMTPLSNYAVARAAVSLPHGFTAGAIFTDVHRAEISGQSVYRGLCLNTGEAPSATGRCFRDASTADLDLRWSGFDGEWLGSLHLLGSRIHDGPTRTLRDGTVLGAGDMGFGARAQVARASGVFIGQVLFETYSPTLELNDVGYLRTQNLIRVFSRFGARLFDVGPFQQTHTSIEFFARNSYDGDVIARGIQLNNLSVWNNFWQHWLELQWYPKTFDNRESHDGLRAEKPQFWGGNWYLTTNQQKAFYADWTAATGNTWKGLFIDTSMTLNVRPVSRLQVALAPSFTYVSGDPRWVETIGSTYRFGLQNALAVAATLRSTLTFTPQLTLQLYAQLFFAHVSYSQLYEESADGRYLLLDQLKAIAADPHGYDSRSVALNVNLVFRWEFRPGSALYLVYTHAQSGDPGYDPELSRPRIDFSALGKVPAEDIFLVKASYYFAR
jgi:hypothetical protein